MSFLNPFSYSKYISPEEEDNVRNFKYKGGSDSITYKYIWSPFSQFLVDKFVPEYVAPNLITITSFFLVWFWHIIYLYYSPDFKSEVDWKINLGYGIVAFMYQILDNMDGKQARKTGNSSALGMIFDHNGDSVTCWVLSSTFPALMGIGFGKCVMIIVVISSFMTFYSANWLQNQLGVFKLSYINAIDEGFILCWSYYFITAYFGQSIWQHEIYPGLTLGWLQFYTVGILAFLQNVYFWIHVWRESKFKGKQMYQNQYCQIIMIATMIVILQFSQQEVYNNFTCYIIIASLGFIQSKATLHLQIANLGDEKGVYSPMRKSYFVVTLGYIINTLSYKFTQDGQSVFDEHKFAICMLVIAAYSYFHTAVCVILQMCNVLNIRALKVKPKTQ